MVLTPSNHCQVKNIFQRCMFSVNASFRKDSQTKTEIIVRAHGTRGGNPQLAFDC